MGLLKNRVAVLAGVGVDLGTALARAFIRREWRIALSGFMRVKEYVHRTKKR